MASAVDKQVRRVQRRLLEASYGAAFGMLQNTTNLATEILLDALEACANENDPSARVLQLHRDWVSAGNMTALGYQTFASYVRWRCSAESTNP